MTLRLLIFSLLLTTVCYSQPLLEFYPESGIHPGLDEISVRVNDDSKVYYTTNGSKPGAQDKQLKSGILSIRRTTAYRFLIITDNDTIEQTKTYIVDKSHNLPVFSIITDSTYLFDPVSGMYMKGLHASKTEPYHGANYWKNWERSAHIAFINEENKQVIDQKAGLQMFGGFSMAMPQKSFALYARNEYGNNRFEYPFFDNRPFKEYKDLVLRNAGGDMQGAHIRDAYAASLIESTGLLVQAYRPVAVYINGIYWGKYNLREKINEHFINQHYDYDTDSLIIMRHEKLGQHGSTIDYVRFWNKLPYLNLSRKKDLDYVKSKIDIDNYLLYNTCEIYTGNADAGGNIRYFKHVGDTAKWRWIFYDVDHSMNIFEKYAHRKNSVEHFTTKNPQDWPHPNWSTFLIRKLLENDSIKNIYIQRFCDQLNTTFQPERALDILDSISKEVEEEMIFHRERWNVKENIYRFSLRKLYSHVQQRPALLFKQLQDRFNLAGTVEVEVNPSKGGSVYLNSIDIHKPFIGNYFARIPLQIQAKPFFDYEFIGWKGLKHAKSRVDTALITDISITPIFRKRKLSNKKNTVFITEIDAEQGDKYDSDLIEIYNAGDVDLSIGGWILSDDQHMYRIPKNTLLKSKKYLIIAEDSAKLRDSFHSSIVSGLTFGIDKKGEILKLYDIDSCLVDQVNTSYWKHEKRGLNWSRISVDTKDDYFDLWVQELPSPGKENSYIKEMVSNREERKELQFWLILSGIIFALLGISVFLFNLLKR